MVKIGITGGIGSGKSVVSSFLNTMGIPVYIADDEAKRITASSLVVKERLMQHFGSQLYNREGEINKQQFASIIFGNKNNLGIANAIIHPEVLNDFLLWAEQQKENIVAIESAILFESGFDVYVDHILTVTAPLEMRIQRVVRRSGISREEIMKRISNQIPDEWKIRKSNVVIYNDDVQPIIPQVERIFGLNNYKNKELT